MNLQSEICVTAAIRRWDGRYLLLKRAKNKCTFPGFWTLPGGHVETQDFEDELKTSDGLSYNVIENAIRREVREEAGIRIRNIGWLASMFGNLTAPTLIISLTAELASFDEPIINEESSDYGWFNLSEAGGIKLIEGIYDELILAEEKF